MQLTVDGATIVFVFLPAELAGGLVASVLGRIRPKGRVIAHEQAAVTWAVEPLRSEFVVGDGVTVAHLWQKV